MPELSWADWDWLIDYAGDDEDTPLESVLLHAPSPDAAVFFGRPDWDADSWSGAVLCGAMSQAWGIPGIFSRIDRMRCPQCCDLVGYPEGTGSPKNDAECRKILKPGGCDQQERETDQEKRETSATETEPSVQRLLATVIAEGWPLGRTGLTTIDFDIARAILSDSRVKVTATESEENRNA